MLLQNHRRGVAAAFITAATALGLAGPAGAETPAQLRALEDTGVREVIVRREAGLDAADRRALRASVDATLVETSSLPGVEVLRVPAGRLDEAVAELSADPDVRWVEANGPVHATTTDPYYLWGFANDGRSSYGQTGVADADADVPEAWERGTGAGVTVGVVDTGIDLSHPDLATRIATNPGESGNGRESNGVDDDRNGKVDDWRGWDWVAADATASDENRHGTHVAGTIAAERGNGIGVAGVAPDARVLPLRALDANGSGWDSDIAAAFDYAGRLGIPVVNASLGGVGSSPAERDAIRRHPDTLYVVAAGNDGMSIESTAYSPCTIPEPNVVCVGATDNRDRMAYFSNRGATQVDLFAPGQGIASALPGGGYGGMSGTSMATPHVAGVAALLRGVRPDATTGVLRAAILDGADRLAELAGQSVTGARLNAAGALAALPEPPAPETVVAPVTVPEPDPVPAPAPVPAPEPTPAPQPTPDPEPQPEPQPEPISAPAPTPSPTPVPAPTPSPTPAPKAPKAKGPIKEVRVRVQSRRATATVTLNRPARVRVALSRGGATTARTRALASGSATVRLGRLRPGVYRVRVHAETMVVERRFTVR